MSEQKKLTSVKVDNVLYKQAQHLFLENNVTFQEFVNACLYTFVNDIDDFLFILLGTICSLKDHSNDTTENDT